MMWWHRSLLVWLCLWSIFQYTQALNYRSYFTVRKTSKEVNDPVIQDAAKYAVDELSRLSDTGIYETLKLEKIFDAQVEIGDFHYIIHLQLALSSPFFESQKALENYQMMVLESKDQYGKPTGSKSIAIDEFPAMQEDAIEQFWIEMVEARRERRRQLFKEWSKEDEEEKVEEQQQQQEDTSSTTSSSPTTTTSKKQQPSSNRKVKKKMRLEDLQKMSTKKLRILLNSDTNSNTSTSKKKKMSPELRQAITTILDERWDLLEQMEQMEQQQQEEEKEKEIVRTHRREKKDEL